MKNTLVHLSIIFLLITSLSFSTRENKVRKYEITGKIINEVILSPGCGYLAQATVIEFEIINSNLKNYPDKNIPIIIQCPEFYGDCFFEKNKTYTLHVMDKSGTDFGWTITNLSVQKKYNLEKKLWTISIKKEE
ncbi:hypothetical protein [Chryseobacterium sp. Mn2064]|uniref:hypothetical protein n=1 Tax=Chryseobacterium sp. Mn2064 TaxID=3395263 RepID=UPI003BC351BC